MNPNVRVVEFCDECRQKLNAHNSKCSPDWYLYFIKPQHGAWISPKISDWEWIKISSVEVTFRWYPYYKKVKLEVVADDNWQFAYFSFKRTPEFWELFRIYANPCIINKEDMRVDTIYARSVVPKFTTASSSGGAAINAGRLMLR